MTNTETTTTTLADTHRAVLDATNATLVDDPGFGYGFQPTEHETPEAMVAHLTDSGYAAGIEPGYGVVAYAVDGNGLHGVLEGTGWAATGLTVAGMYVPSMYLVERAYQLPPVDEFRTVCPRCLTVTGSGCATCRPDSVLGG